MSKHPKSHFLIAAPSSDSGKTTLTLGLLRALAKRGLQVQPFKCGPDYIDTIHHTTAAGWPSINLDLFMASENHVQALYQHFACAADVAIAEGVMGLFDGSNKMQASSAAMAELLNIPVILVINAKAMAYSVAPLLYGFKNFYPGIRVVGAIFNFVNTASHYRFLQDACADVGVEAMGYLPNNPHIAIPSRHLGLHVSAETDYKTIIERIADAIPATIDMDRLLAVTRMSLPATPDRLILNTPITISKKHKIAIARDEAFCFTYHQNIQVLAQLGEICYFSPLRDAKMPEADFLYLPGGYPELHAEALSTNTSMRQNIATYCLQGGLTYAECGGLMYLGKSITDAQGRSFPMVGVLDCTTSMENARMTLGYRMVHWNEQVIKGHEFHYSHIREHTSLSSIAHITNAKGIAVDTKLYRQQNTLASYLHLYWGDNPDFVQRLFQLATKDCNC